MNATPDYTEIYKLMIGGLGSIILILLTALGFFLVHYFKTVPIFAELSGAINELKLELQFFHATSADDAVKIHDTLKEHGETLKCHEKEIILLKKENRRKRA